MHILKYIQHKYTNNKYYQPINHHQQSKNIIYNILTEIFYLKYNLK